MTVLAGRYELLERVGEGGMSVVWRARDTELEREVAIKLLRSVVASDPAQSRRFHREARALAALAHDQIVRIYDYVSNEEQSFLVMEYVAGENLAQATRGRLPLNAAEAAAYLQPVAQALEYAHARGVVHRDLTPTNILIERGTGRVVTTDFGLARIARATGSLTATGVLLGTPEYWSPELALGRETGAETDLYALGCILFLLTSGKLPFEGDDRLAVGLRRAHDDAPSLGVLAPGAPQEAVALVDSLLARDPDRRPDAGVVAAALGKLADGAAVKADPDRQAEAAPEPATVAVRSEQQTTQLAPRAERRRWARRRLLGAAAASLGVIVAALFLAGQIHTPLAQVPSVISLREDVARAQLRRAIPSADVSVTHVYSAAVAAGRVIRQSPAAKTATRAGMQIQLVVSKGSPYASVPALSGQSETAARTALARAGFASRRTYSASWTVRKGSVIELRPRTGTRLRRPARVTIVVASGYPRAVVPDVRSSALADAEARLAAVGLRYRLVWELTDAADPDQVLDQIPAAGTSVYQGARIRLTIARTLHWVKLFARSGSDSFDSDVFNVSGRWRIRYRLSPNPFGLALAQFAWAGSDEIGGSSFVATKAGSLRTFVPTNGSGSYRLSVRPYAGAGWYVEVDALE
jgi:beta-lactam-binding protein with PASTA domain/predicted Ser/Thr protein kinase